MSEVAREHRERDAEARRLARTRFDLPLVVEAGAGTGKTTVLVTRTLAWCLGPGWLWSLRERPDAHPDDTAARVARGVVAITFTDAAAAEMGSRLAAALVDVVAGEPPSWLPDDALPGDPVERTLRARALLGALDQVRVQTIHAFCRRLLVAHPLEAGVHPQLELDADGALREEIVREVLEERLPAAWAEPGSAALRLAELGMGPAQIEEALLALLEEGVTADDLALDAFAPDRLAELHGRVAAALDAWLSVGECVASIRRSPTACAVHEAIDALRSALPGAPWSASGLAEYSERCRQEWPGDDALATRLNDWGRGVLNASESKAVPDPTALAAASRELAPLLRHLGEIDPERLDLARRVIGELLAEVGSRLRVRGIATFAELLSRARDLLIRHPGVAARERERIQQLLVDEFQDTDRTQCEVLRALALEGDAARRPGLFLVGDPKQSIYGWRSADLAAYEGFRDEVVAAGGAVAPLHVNYRSIPAVLEEVARVVEPVMQPEPRVQPAFEPLIPHRERADEPLPEGLAPIEYWIPSRWDEDAGAPATRTRAREATALEAAALSRELRALHDAGRLAWKDVGVLFRGRGDLETYLDELRSAGIPFAVGKDRSYFRRREIIEAAALVRAIADPNDHVALLAAMRSSLAGVPDAALLPLWREDLPSRVGRLVAPCADELVALRELATRVARELPDDVPGIAEIEGWHEALAALLEAIADLRRSLAEDPADVFVERLRTLCLFEVTEAHRHVGPWRVANLDRFFRELAESLSADGGVPGLLRALRRAVAAEQEREESRPREATQDAVTVMTIHGAKGLDFRHVYLMQLHKEPGRGRSNDFEVGRERPDGPLELRLQGAATPGFDRIAKERERVARAERVRTLYVAMTRAEDRLVLVGLWPRDVAADKGSLAELVARGLAPGTPPEERMAELAAAGVGDDRIDADGARWRFPALAAPVGAARGAPARAGTSAPTAKRVARDSSTLHDLRQKARARSERPFAATASGSVGEEDREALAERLFGDAPRAAAATAGAAAESRNVARAVGIAIHGVLEEIDLERDPAAALEWALERLDELVRAAVEPHAESEAVASARALMKEISDGKLLSRLRELGRNVLYRELPVLIPAGDADPAVAALSGVIDLVYREPESGEFVIADYKTDRVDGAQQLRASAARYAPQGEVYQRALRDGLGLAYTPRFELWFLHADEIVPGDSAV